MDCQTAIEYINMYVDNVLDDAETEELLDHIRACQSCKKELESITSLKSALAGIKEVDPPAGLALSALKKARKRRLPLFAYASAGIAAVIVIVTVLSTGVIGDNNNAQEQNIAYSGIYTEYDGVAEKAAMPEEAPEAEMAPLAPDECSTLQEAAREESGAGMSAADTSAYSIPVAPEYSESFRLKLDAFIKKYDIEIEQTDNTIAFTIPEEYAAELQDMISESGIDFDGELTAGVRGVEPAVGLRVEVIFE